jgi:UDP-N-acetylmuramoyl-tripeptide--D-alanyl-D-alanine ligase
VVTADTPVEAPLTEYLRGMSNVVRFGFSPEADLRASDVAHTVVTGTCEQFLGLRFKINGRTACTLRLLGEHNASNALAAFAVGRRFGLEPERIVEALGRARGPEMRLEPTTIPTGSASPPVIVINDAYNANPDSMQAGLHAFADIAESLAGQRPTRCVAVLGDMMEQGSAAEASHREIGERARGMSGLELVMLVGEQMDRWARPVLAGPAGRGSPRVVSEPVGDAPAVERVAGEVMPGDLVLLKGSRGMRLERVLEALRRRFSEAGVGRMEAPTTPCPT